MLRAQFDDIGFADREHRCAARLVGEQRVFTDDLGWADLGTHRDVAVLISDLNAQPAVDDDVHAIGSIALVEELLAAAQRLPFEVLLQVVPGAEVQITEYLTEDADQMQVLPTRRGHLVEGLES